MEIQTINDRTLREIAEDVDDAAILWDALNAIDTAVFLFKDTNDNDCKRLLMRSIEIASRVHSQRVEQARVAFAVMTNPCALFDTVNAKFTEIEKLLEAAEQGGAR
jgi:hypothetical protein